MDDAPHPTDVIVEPADSATTLQQQLARRGIGGYDVVSLPWSDSKQTDPEVLTPAGPRTPIDPAAFQELHTVVDATDTTTVSISGAVAASELVTDFAAYRDLPLVSINPESTSADSVYGHPLRAGNVHRWIPGTLARAFRMTATDEVLLHIGDATELHTDELQAMVALLSGRTTVEFDDGVTADLSNLTVFVTDVGGVPAIESTVGVNMYTRAFDTTVHLPAHKRYDTDRESKILNQFIGLPSHVADAFTEAATALRWTAEDDNSPVTVAPTSKQVAEWAIVALDYDSTDAAAPAVDAGETAILQPLYCENRDAHNYAEKILVDSVEGVFDWE